MLQPLSPKMKPLFAALLLAALLHPAIGLSSGWYWGEPLGSCDERCAALTGATYKCELPRLTSVGEVPGLTIDSAVKFRMALAAMVYDGRPSPMQCSVFEEHYEAETPMFTQYTIDYDQAALVATGVKADLKLSGGKCYFQKQVAAGVGSNEHCYSKDDGQDTKGRRLCCCINEQLGETGKAMCPWSAAHCAAPLAFAEAVGVCLAWPACGGGMWAKPAAGGIPATCELCPAGKRGTAAVAQSEASGCVPCESGRFTSEAGKSACDGAACAPGTIGDVGALTNASSVCRTCPAGTYSSPAADACISCGLNAVPDALGGASACVDCAAAKVADSSGAFCDWCPAGKAANHSTAVTVCEACPKGKFVAGGGAACASCAPGWVPSKLGATCLICEASKYMLTLYSDPANTTVEGYVCRECDVGESSPQGATACTLCTAGEFFDATLGTCTRCATGEYSRPLEKGGETCSRCPPLGVSCADSQLRILPHYWAATVRNRSTELERRGIVFPDTNFYPCANSYDACTPPKLDELKVECDVSKGYGGVICGVCDLEGKGAVRNGELCTLCGNVGASVFLLIVIITIIFVTIVYFVLVQKPDTGADAQLAKFSGHVGAVFKIITTYGQMLFILGAYKANGGAIFRLVFTWWFKISGGAISAMAFVKCATLSQVYAPFWIGALAPIAILLLTLLLIPCKWRFERLREARRRADTFGTDAPETRMRCTTIPNAGGTVDHAATVLCAWALRPVPMSSHDVKEWMLVKVKEKQIVYHPFPRFIRVGTVIFYMMYPTLVLAAIDVMRCTPSINGKHYLIADYATECYSDEHNTYIAFGVLVVICYAIGIPLISVIFLACFRKRLKQGDVPVVNAISFLTTGLNAKKPLTMVAWDAGVLLRKFAAIMISTFDLSPIVQQLYLVVLMGVTLLITANAKPHEVWALNALDEWSIVAVIVVQAITMGQVDAGLRVNDVDKGFMTGWLILVNVLILIAFFTALILSLARKYSVKCGLTLMGEKVEKVAQCIAYFMKEEVKEDEWARGRFLPDQLELMAVGMSGGIEPLARGTIVKWQDSKTGVVIEPVRLEGGQVIPPPLGMKMAFVDKEDVIVGLHAQTAVWVDTRTGTIVEPTEMMRMRTLWQNQRTGEVVAKDPLRHVLESDDEETTTTDLDSIDGEVQPELSFKPARGATYDLSHHRELTIGSVDGSGSARGGGGSSGSRDVTPSPRDEPSPRGLPTGSAAAAMGSASRSARPVSKRSPRGAAPSPRGPPTGSALAAMGSARPVSKRIRPKSVRVASVAQFGGRRETLNPLSGAAAAAANGGTEELPPPPIKSVAAVASSKVASLQVHSVTEAVVPGEEVSFAPPPPMDEEVAASAVASSGESSFAPPPPAADL